MVQSTEEQHIGLKLHTAHNSGYAVRYCSSKSPSATSHTRKPLGEMAVRQD